MIDSAALLLTGISLLLLLVRPHIGLLAAILSKPVIDLSWSYREVFGLGAVDIIGVFLPGILLFRIIMFPSDRPVDTRYIWLWIFYIFANLIGFSIMLVQGHIVWTLSLFFRIMNGFACFYAFQTYFRERDLFQKLLIIYLLAGLVPMLMGLYEVASGESWRLRWGAAGQQRITGLYHNSTAYRYYGYMTLTAIVLYWSYFLRRGYVMKALLLAYAGISCVVLHHVYSKAAITTLGLGLIIWTVFYKKYLLLSIVVLGMLIFYITAGDKPFFEDIATTFTHETAVLEGTENVDRLLAGRVGGWRQLLNNWSEMDALHRLFGAGASGRGGGHNDYLRALVNSGLFGLTTYITLLFGVGFGVLTNLLKRRTPLNIMALIIYCGWMIDTIGLAPGTYTNYQWYVWGYVAIALHGVRGLAVPGLKNAAMPVYNRTPRRRL